MGRFVSARRAQAQLAIGAATLVLAVACLVPLLALAVQLVSGDALTQLQVTLGQVRLWVLLLESIGLALAVTVVAAGLGITLGALLGHTDVGGRRVALVLHGFPLFLPPFLLAFGWFHLFARDAVLGSAWTSHLLFGPLGVVLVSSLAFAPLITVMTVLGLQGIDPALEEAARVTSPPLRVMTRILLPLSWPSIALGAILVFALALSEVGVPMFLGVRTYPAAVFTRLGGFDYAPGEAVALVLPLLAIGWALVALDHRLLGRGSFAALGSRSRRTQAMSLGRSRRLVTAGVWLICLLPLAPLVALLAIAGVRGILDAIPWLGASMGTSLRVSAVAATVIVAAGLVQGHALARGRSVARALDGLTMLAFMVPSSVLGIGLVFAWNRGVTQAVYTSSVLVVLGLVARYGFIGVRTLAAVFHRSSAHYEEAAAALGAGYLRTMAAIVVPMHWRGLAAAWIVAMVFCLRDLDTVISIYSPGLEPLPVRIFTLEANGPEAVVAGLSILHVAITALVVTLGGMIVGWGGRKR